IGGTAVTLTLYVQDVDRTYEQAIAAGGKAVMPVADQFWGDRYGILTDPFGHAWAVATHKEDLTPEQIRQRMGAMAG
ncbi:MAG TPA: VOC family protein, partial [Candidatus Udaeobacter sp.]|nr:VOC family protein [Candidatus Udaeobacter sp.]